MRIVINDYLGHAPQMQLSRALARRGHDVLHLYSGDVQLPKADLTRQAGDPASLTIEGLLLGTPPARSFLSRRLQEARFGWLVAQRAMTFNLISSWPVTTEAAAHERSYAERIFEISKIADRFEQLRTSAPRVSA